MTQREKVMATALVAALAVVGGGAVFYLFVYEPIMDARAQIDAEQDKVTKAHEAKAKEAEQIAAIFRVNPRLGQWQKISLPPRDPAAKKKVGVSLEEKKQRHLSQLQVEYERYLFNLMRRNGFRNDSIAVKAARGDRRAAPMLRPKEPVFDRLAFTVSGQGTADALARMLKAFHTTPLLHQIRTMTVSLTPPRVLGPTPPRGAAAVPSGSLDVNFTVEALLVNGAEDREALMPAKLAYPPPVLAQPARNYDVLAKRNMFTGVVSTSAGPGSTPTSPTVVSEDRREALRFVKLTMLWYNEDRHRWEATMYDQARGGKEMSFNTRVLNDLKINGKGEDPVLDAKVVLIDEKQLVFKEGDKFYRVGLGEFLFPAVRKTLTNRQVRDLGLTPAS
jgi:hypothetical protein